MRAVTCGVLDSWRLTMGASPLSIRFLPNRRVVLGMLAEKGRCQGTDHIYAKVLLLRVFASRLGVLGNNTAAKPGWRHFRMPDLHPALTVCPELEIRNFSVVFDFEPASGDLIWLSAHSSAYLLRKVFDGGCPL